MTKHLFIGDNLPILRNMQSESVDLIYLDPPFNSGKQWGNPIKAQGRKAEVAFKDTWALSDIHVDEEYELRYYAQDAIPLINALHKINGGSWRAYLIYMGVRLAEMRRVLKESGTIYYHCDPVMSHGVKLLMDSIFGKKNFRNEIIWGYRTQGVSMSDWPRKHDVLLCYKRGGGNRYIIPSWSAFIIENLLGTQKRMNPGGIMQMFISAMFGMMMKQNH